MRKVALVEGEYYHIYNRGVDKRTIFQDQEDLSRFFQSMEEFNYVEPIGSIFQNSFNKKRKNSKKLVEIICYCLNPNHFHFVLRQFVENGISEFMKSKDIEKSIQLGMGNSVGNLSQIGSQTGLLKKGQEFEKVEVKKEPT